MPVVVRPCLRQIVDNLQYEFTNTAAKERSSPTSTSSISGVNLYINNAAEASVQLPKFGYGSYLR